MLPKPLVQAPPLRERTSTTTISSPRRATTSSSRYESRKLVATISNPRSPRKRATSRSALRPLAVRLLRGAALGGRLGAVAAAGFLVFSAVLAGGAAILVGGRIVLRA